MVLLVVLKVFEPVLLETLNQESIGPYRLEVERIGPPKFFDQFNFGIYLRDARGNRTHAPVFRGLYNAGRPSLYTLGWIDGEFVEQTADPSPALRAGSRPQAADRDRRSAVSGRPSVIVTMELAEQLAQKLGTLIPPGGRMWLAYESYAGEGAIISETKRGLKATLPLLSTPIGFLLFRADCWCGLKNLHFPEGGREGPMKLQGNKALNIAHARERALENIAELEALGGRVDNSPNELEQRAQVRAQIVLAALKKNSHIFPKEHL